MPQDAVEWTICLALTALLAYAFTVSVLDHKAEQLRRGFDVMTRHGRQR